MITLDLKIKVHSKEKKYDEKYASNYLQRRQKSLNEDKEYFKNLFSKYNINLSNKNVLDLAAGAGVDLKILSDFNPKRLIWHDKMDGAYKLAKKYLERLDNVIFNKKDLMDLKIYEDKSVDFVICRSSLYYIGNDYYFFKRIKKLLTTEGFFWATNNTFEYYQKNLMSNESLTKKLRHKFFDWPLYKFTGLRLFTFLPVDKNRLNYLFKKLNFNIIFLKEKENNIEFLIKK